jgi:tRNA dimethylallyltransferase
MNKLLIICGPTATGKTALAIALAKRLNGELISADSRQVYRGMDIGTGKDIFRRSKIKDQRSKIKIENQIYELIPYDMDGIPLWMVDVVNPDEEFSVAHYQYLATSVINDIQKRGKLPIIVGGTGLYVTSLLSPIETSHIPPNKQLRKTLERHFLEELQMKLKKDDPLVWDLMNQSDRQNPRRLMRKIEIARYGKDKEMSTSLRRGFLLHQGYGGQVGGQAVRQQELNTLIIGLTAAYPVLYERIDQRVEKRVKQGIIEEVTTLLKKGYSWDLPSMNTFGYKEWKDYFILPHNSLLITHAIQRWKWDEHGYARRQMTWFKNMKGIWWFNVAQVRWQEKVEARVSSWYT